MIAPSSVTAAAASLLVVLVEDCCLFFAYGNSITVFNGFQKSCVVAATSSKPQNWLKYTVLQQQPPLQLFEHFEKGAPLFGHDDLANVPSI